ncbi:MAG TPA: F0F1 ATP synthase subunit epsilon [Firmicutes bacterium]|nr:F0F1 ATP synthase subunit epsilon [Bacillota bacterium]
MTVPIDIVTAEKIVHSDDVDILIAPGRKGQLGILPGHAPLIATLVPGELIVRKSDQEYIIAISGGFLEVRPDRIIVLADAAERAEEIDIQRAEDARRRAKESLSRSTSPEDAAIAEAALKRAIARLDVASRVAHRRKSQH